MDSNGKKHITDIVAYKNMQNVCKQSKSAQVLSWFSYFKPHNGAHKRGRGKRIY